MTPQEVETAIRDQGCGWENLREGVVDAAEETPGYCNANYCASLAHAGTVAGVTPADVGAAVRALVDGDDTLLRVILSP